MVGAWSDGVLDPRSWGFGSEPVHEYVVRSRASRLRTLRRLIACLPEASSSCSFQHQLSQSCSRDTARHSSA